jgi:hypothetical protein
MTVDKEENFATLKTAVSGNCIDIMWLAPTDKDSMFSDWLLCNRGLISTEFT